MKNYNLQESYNKFVNNTLTRSEFQRLLNRSPFNGKLYTQTNSVEDVVTILKNKKYLVEAPIFHRSPVQEIERINKPEYAAYIFSVKQGKIVGGFNDPNVAREKAKELLHTGIGPLKLASAKVLSTKYHIDPNDNGSWGDNNTPDPDGNDELSEDAGISDKVSSDIDSMLNELRSQFEEGWQEKLPDDYDDDLKSAGLGENKELNELSADTVTSAMSKMGNKDQHNRASKLATIWTRKVVGLPINDFAVIARCNLFPDKTIRLSFMNDNKIGYGGAEYNPYNDKWDVSREVELSRKGARVLGKVASMVNPNTQYTTGTGDLKIAGY